MTSAPETPAAMAPPPALTPVREQILDFLRRELVGPDPIAPNVQANGEEILVNDPPRLRYGAGVLFPQTALLEIAADAAPGEIPAAPSEDSDETDAAPVTDAIVGTELGAGEGEAEADELVSLANAFLPSAMGFSCLAEVPKRGLKVVVRAATYAPERKVQIGKDGKEYPRNYYNRKPFEATVTLPTDKLLAEKRCFRTFPVTGEGVPPGLEIRVLSRPIEDEPDWRLLTLALINTYASNGRAENEKCFFQVELTLRAPDGAAVFREYPDEGLIPDEEECSLALLYRHRKTYGIGHGCAAKWHEVDNENGLADAIWCDVLPQHEIKPIVPRVFPDLTLSMLDLSDRRDENNLEPLLSGLCNRYEAWIDDQKTVLNGLELPEEQRAAATRHLGKCRECLERMRGGVLLLRGNEQARRAFRLANRAMLQQQLHYALGTDGGANRAWTFSGSGKPRIAPVVWPDIENPPSGKGTWYPFQLAFLLMNLRSLAELEGAERKIVDLIWFPTGGGKTEAYLGLTAFTILMRRLQTPDDGGTAVLMRYTLRLLTAQQFQRAASLICALEKMRQSGEIPGSAPITIGLWAGGDLTPNKRADAVTALAKLDEGEARENKFVVLNCPWCGAKMGPVESEGQGRTLGYERVRTGAPINATTVVFRCADASCDFGGGSKILPLCVIDEDLYSAPPTVLLGTVDKFAMLPWQKDSRAFFGLRDGWDPPDLIIQDELHLISGPLGSMVGHYETVINQLCVRRGEDGTKIGPKIIASTATISRAGEQCHALWNCGKEQVFQFPPQFLKAGDSFFALEDEKAKGRVYVGVHASALGSHVTSQVRAMAALLQAVLSAQTPDDGTRDPYWTMICYYNSLRELGHAATLLRADIREYMNAMWLRLGIEKPKTDDVPDLRRFINRDLELTSRIPSGQIPEALQQLFSTYPGSKEERPVDVALATNMISVGVDVPRLGLMTVAGQPKTTSEYIQATSRVGRSKSGPGLVVMIYNTGKPRDRSHYEHFHSYHGAVYRAVEPTSVTPFSSPVRDRALHAILTTLVRFRGTSDNMQRPAPAPDDALWDEIEAIVDERVSGVDGAEREATLKQLREKMEQWSRIMPPRYGKPGGAPDVELPLLYPAGSVPAPAWEGKAWPTPMSMRDVDASCEAQVLGQYPRPTEGKTDV